MTAGLAVLRRPAIRKADTLMVLLPGAYMGAQHFLDAGFDTAVAQRRLALDLVFPDVAIAEFASAEGAARLRREMLEPALAAGYRRLWLGGISLGGFVALALAAEHGEAIDGLCLIAPYPGSAITLAAIDAAGGPARWDATAEQLGDAEFRLWHWWKTPRPAPQIVFGYGREDRFAPRIGRLAEARAGIAPLVVEGGHDWPAWRTVWEQFLDDGPLADALRSKD
jgi:pimeloyl-ACP methyl ester carboxylesterase